MKETIVILCKEMNMGGTETLIMRLLKWYKNNGFRTIILTLEEIISESILEDLNEVKLECYVLNSTNKEFESFEFGKLQFQSTENPLLLTFFLPEFFKCFELLTKSKYKCNFRFTIYIVHPYSTFISNSIRFLGKTLMHIFLTKNMLVFMDEICLEATVDFYKLYKSKYNFYIYRLPIFIKGSDLKCKMLKNEMFNILSISRFEFPFKGYVIGLINTFVELFKTNNNLSLTIIGYGIGKIEVDKALHEIPLDIRSNIFILDQVPYSLIDNYIEKCDIYVGMGTTLLDAANHNKIGIIAVSYQMDANSNGFFHNNFSVLGDLFDDTIIYPHFKEMISDIVNLNNEEFSKLSLESKKTLVDNYNIDLIAPKLFEHTKSNFNKFESSILKLTININKSLVFMYNLLHK